MFHLLHLSPLLSLSLSPSSFQSIIVPIHQGWRDERELAVREQCFFFFFLPYFHFHFLLLVLFN